MMKLVKMPVLETLVARVSRRVRLSETEAHAPIDPAMLPVDLNTLSFSLASLEQRHVVAGAFDAMTSGESGFDDDTSADAWHDEDAFRQAA